MLKLSNINFNTVDNSNIVRKIVKNYETVLKLYSQLQVNKIIYPNIASKSKDEHISELLIYAVFLYQKIFRLSLFSEYIHTDMRILHDICIRMACLADPANKGYEYLPAGQINLHTRADEIYEKYLRGSLLRVSYKKACMTYTDVYTDKKRYGVSVYSFLCGFVHADRDACKGLVQGMLSGIFKNTDVNTSTLTEIHCGTHKHMIVEYGNGLGAEAVLKNFNLATKYFLMILEAAIYGYNVPRNTNNFVKIKKDINVFLINI